MSKLEDWLWDEKPMQELGDRYQEYQNSLHEAIYEDVDVETVSGFPYCACEVCDIRETFAFLMPRFLDLYMEGRIQMEKPSLKKRVVDSFRFKQHTSNDYVKGRELERTPKSVTELFNTEPTGSDYLFMGPMHSCVCGCNVFHILASFDEGQVASYFTEAKCASCGSFVRVPTEIDGDFS